MNYSINYEGDWSLDGIMSDLGVQFAQSPLHSISFAIEDAEIQLRAERYADKIFRARRWFSHGELSWMTLLLRFGQSTFLVAHGLGRKHAKIVASCADEVIALHTELRAVLGHGAESKRPSFYLLRHDGGEFSADPIENLPAAVSDEFLRLCYGEDIVDWIARFEERTLARAGGLSIFDGPPGTGKTSLITQMIRRLEDTHVFYSLSVSQDGALSSPELVPFWQTQNVQHAERVKVIVIDDAARLLWRRDDGNSEAVSSLLNIADGLLGRMLRLHVVCSINARMEDLDPAILRPGRLMNHRRFAPLSRDAAERVAAARDLDFAPARSAEAYTLAEALNPGAYEPPIARPGIGFAVRQD